MDSDEALDKPVYYRYDGKKRRSGVSDDSESETEMEFEFPFPESAKGRGPYSKSKEALGNKSPAPSPILAADSTAALTDPTGYCRCDDISLNLLTKKFINLIKHAEHNGVIDLDKAAETLEVPKRRIYDIVDVLEGIGLMEKKLKISIHWKGLVVSQPGGIEDMLRLQDDVEILNMEVLKLNHQIREMQERLDQEHGNQKRKRWMDDDL